MEEGKEHKKGPIFVIISSHVQQEFVHCITSDLSNETTIHR